MDAVEGVVAETMKKGGGGVIVEIEKEKGGTDIEGRDRGRDLQGEKEGEKKTLDSGLNTVTTSHLDGGQITETEGIIEASHVNREDSKWAY